MPLEEKTGGKGKRKAPVKKGKKHGGFEELSVNSIDPMQYMINLDDSESVGGKKKRRAPAKKGKKHGGFEELTVEPETMDMSSVSDETVGGKKKRKPRAKKSMRGGEGEVDTIAPTYMSEEMPQMDDEDQMLSQEEMAYGDEMMMPEEQPVDSMEGGKKKRRAPVKKANKKAGGNLDFKQLIEDLGGGCGNCKKDKKKRGGSDEMPVEMSMEEPSSTGGKKARKPRKSGKA